MNGIPYISQNENAANAMKRTTLIILFALPGMILFSQYVPTPEDLNHLFETKTLVVRNQNPLNMSDGELRKVMEQEWTITEWEMIPYSEFEEKRQDPQYSFLFLTTVIFEKDKLQAKYKFLNLSMGGDYFNLNQMPDLASVPVSYGNVEDESYVYKLGILVRFIQKHILNIHEHPELISSNIFKHYNDNMKDVKTKTLYLLPEEMAKDVNSSARIQEIYPHPFKLVEKSNIQEAIQSKDEEVVFLHKVGPEGTRLDARCYKILIGANNASFYYFDYHMINAKNPDGFLSKDLKKISK